MLNSFKLALLTATIFMFIIVCLICFGIMFVTWEVDVTLFYVSRWPSVFRFMFILLYIFIVSSDFCRRDLMRLG